MPMAAGAMRVCSRASASPQVDGVRFWALWLPGLGSGVCRGLRGTYGNLHANRWRFVLINW